MALFTTMGLAPESAVKNESLTPQIWLAGVIAVVIIFLGLFSAVL
jgi:hypothetical protein